MQRARIAKTGTRRGEAAVPPSTPPEPEERRVRIAVCWIWTLLAGSVALLFLSVTYPPLYDYYHWVFQGDVLGALLFGSEATQLGRLYSVNHFPVPNLGSVVGIALLSRFLAPLAAGRVLLVVTVLGFAGGYAKLMRSVQGRLTALEFAALPFAFGYFLYKGYLSYLLSIALAFGAIATLGRMADPGASRLRRRDLALLAAVAAAVFLVHLMGWLVYALVLATHGVTLLRRGARRRALLLAATLVPSVALLGWYSVSLGKAHKIPLYTSLGDKLLSLESAPLLFLRLDPFGSAVPALAANVVIAAIFAWIVLSSCQRTAGVAAPPLATAAAVLALVALALPFSDVDGMARPDERFVVPALLLAVASLRHAKASLQGVVAAGATGALVLSLHAVEYREASGSFERALAVSSPFVSPHHSVLSVSAFRSRSQPACEDGSRWSIGVPAARWLGLARLRASDAPAVSLMETSALRANRLAPRRPNLTAVTLSPASFSRLDPAAVAGADRLEVFACPGDLGVLRQTAAAAGWSELASTDRYVLFRTR